MAYNPSALFLLALVLFAATNPLVHGQILNLTGRVCCTSNGTCPGSPVSGINVKLNCTILGVSTTVGQGTTNANGFFNISVPGLIGLLGGTGILPCTASVQLPLPNTVCSVLSNTTGLLTSTVNTVGGLVVTLLGLVQNAVLGGFVISI